ncbi:MAG: nuclear transport factor 2 family protein [Cellvibrionales bacterium]|nr:nuclear transport factor 2 family protein [Cellvibrionales bacterium]
MNEFEAKLLIQELVYKYCRAVDRRDYASLAKLYHTDSIDEHGEMFTGSGADFVKWLPKILTEMKLTSHTVTNHLITIQGNIAEGEVYCHAYHITNDNQEIIIGGRYLDKYIYNGNFWQFTHRKIVMDWNQIRPAICDFNSPTVAGTPIRSSIEKNPSTGFFDFFQRQ